MSGTPPTSGPPSIRPEGIRPKAIKPKAAAGAAAPKPGADYYALRAQGIALVEAMSGAVWTDYNYSDPGVTILEQLCYALTELPYRAALPVEEILSPPHGRQLPLRRQGLFPARAILPCNPVTANDLRRLIIDRVPGVANVWFTPRPPRHAGSLSGLYEVAILRSDGRSDGRSGGSDDDPERLIRAVIRRYSAHRGLCEDVLPPRILREVNAYVHGSVVLSEAADPSDTLAQILFSLGLFLAPEPRRVSLDDLLASGESTADVFHGPLMLRGFIQDDQLTPLPSRIGMDQIRKVLAEVRGVSAVNRVSLTVGAHGGHTVDHGGIDVPRNTILRLQTESREGRPTIHMVRNGQLCQPDAARTRRRLAELWRQQRRVHPLHESYARHYGAPASRYRDLASYQSVQDQFPAIYGIGRNGLLFGASAERRAQAKQLKGYLMPFDQLMADFFSQLAFVRELFSVRAGGDSTYAVQSLRGIVPGAEPLLQADYEAGLRALSARTDPVDERRNAILDLLLSFYAERAAAPGEAPEGPDTAKGDAADVIRIKQAMLRRIDSLTRNRGKGLDYLHPLSERGASGVERMSLLQLGLIDPADDQAAGPDAGADDGPLGVSDPAEASFGRPVPTDVVLGIQHHFRPAGDDAANDDAGGAGRSSWRQRSPLAGHRVAHSLLAALHDRSRYRLISMQGDAVVIVCVDVDGQWWLIDECRSEFHALAALGDLVRAAGEHRRRRRRRSDLTIVEWILLRYAGKGRADGARYNFRISAVLPADARDGDAENWRSRSREVVRANTPAHVAVDCLYLDEDAMARFRALYAAWVEALRDGQPQQREKTSRRLEAFLIQHGPPPTDDAPPTDAKAKGPAPEAPAAEAAAPEPPPPATVEPPEPAAPATPAPAAPAPEPSRSRKTRNGKEKDKPKQKRPGSALGKLLSRLRNGKSATSPAAVQTDTPKPSGDGGAAQAQPAPPATAATASTAGAAPSSAASPAPKRSQPKTAQKPKQKQKQKGSWLGNLLSRLGFGKPSTNPAPSPTDAPQPSGGSQPAQEPTQAPTQPPAQGSAQSAPPGAVGFDTDTALTASTAAAFREAGFVFAIRYVSRTTPEAAGDLSADEVTAILGAGLALMAVQHAPPAGWTPSPSLGQTYGQAAAANAGAVGLAKGTTLWLDLEGVAAGTPSDTVVQYCNAWFEAVSKGGYLPGVYVGANSGLNADQLGTSLDCAYFWQSGSKVPAFTTPGYCMVQTIDGDYELQRVTYDEDRVQADADGKTPVWMAPTARTTPTG